MHFFKGDLKKMLFLQNFQAFKLVLNEILIEIVIIMGRIAHRIWILN